MRIKKGLALLLTAVFAVVLAIAGIAFAFNATGNPNDTPTGTPIKFHEQKNSLDYINPNLSSEATEYSSTLEVTVTTEAGMNTYQSPEELLLYTTPGVSVTWELTVTNEGNTAVTFSLTMEPIAYSGTASNWVAQLYNGSSWGSSVSKALPDNSEISVKARIVPSAVETESPDGSRGTVKFYITDGYPDASSGGTYMGVNALTYAGWNSMIDFGSAEIEAPVMTLTRTLTVDAPIAYTGNHHDPVPGAVMTYTVSYSNDGAGDAKDVIIVDKVPNDTTGFSFNYGNGNGGESLTNVTIEAAYGTGTGWSMRYSTVEAPNFDYGNASDWISAGTLTVGNEKQLLPAATTKFVKWEKAAVSAGEGPSTLVWNVTIK